MKTFVRILLRGFAMLLSFFLIHVLVILAYGFSNDTSQSDIIVIYGNQVMPNGDVSQRLKDRLDKGLELYKAGLAPLIITSGAIDVNGHDEALIMKQYLVQKGLPESAIVADYSGINSSKTSDFVSHYLGEHNLSSVTCVSQYSHLLRAVTSMRARGVSEVHHVCADFRFQWSDFATLPREFIGFYYYLLTGK